VDGFTWSRITKLADDWLPEPANPSSLAKRTLCRQTPKVGAVCGNSAHTDAPERHEYELYLAVENIAHTRTKVKSPQTNGIVERSTR
jgi:hypothetical protein